MTSTSAGDQQPAAAAAAAASTPSATRDYYQLLGIERTADQTAIKKLSVYHPDKTGNDPALGERFQLIQKAYETLSDERKRTVYDTYVNVVLPCSNP
ncbi:hypothetical protein BASA83_010846 [Batrachochytrium salamandrivorans]|nr:hypothetical protein BASA83_010846 [Batrachochytrium salamandrivorans]